jgi:hypothetical protein
MFAIEIYWSILRLARYPISFRGLWLPTPQEAVFQSIDEEDWPRIRQVQGLVGLKVRIAGVDLWHILFFFGP